MAITILLLRRAKWISHGRMIYLHGMAEWRFFIGSICLGWLLALTLHGCVQRTTNTVALTEEADLGRRLFYDVRLSINQTRSCATCHNPDFAFTDGYKRSLGAFADLHQRNTSSLFNLGEQLYLTAADSTLHDAYHQMQKPLFARDPVEMGADLEHPTVINRIRQDPRYQSAFKRVFGLRPDSISWHAVRMAIRSFVYTLRSETSRFDAFRQGKVNLTAQERKGMALFYSKALHCGSCHGGRHFNTPVWYDSTGSTRYYFNTGLYNVGGLNRYPAYDEGLYARTKQDQDRGAFRVPSLRNIGFTAPYFHDGSAETLEQVIRIYEAGGRNIVQGADAGDGRSNRYKDSRINGFTLSDEDRRHLIAFLQTLNDTAAMRQPAYRLDPLVSPQN